MLNRDAALQRSHALEVTFADRFGVIEEPSQAGKRHFLIYAFKDVEEAGDRLVIGCMQPERPAVLDE